MKIVVLILIMTVISACGRENINNFKCKREQLEEVKAYAESCSRDRFTSYDTCYKRYVKNFCEYQN